MLLPPSGSISRPRARMTSLPSYSSWFWEFLTGTQERRHHLKEKSRGGAAHVSSSGPRASREYLFGFDAHHRRCHACAARFFFALSANRRSGLERRVAHIAPSTQRRCAGRSFRKPRHAASRRPAPCHLRTGCALTCKRVVRAVSVPRPVGHQWIFGARAGVSRRHRTGESVRRTRGSVPSQHRDRYLARLWQ
jgi:hypothetical protein